MGILLGNVFETFTMMQTTRVLLLDRDCSKELNVGELIEVEFTSGAKTKVCVFDAFLENGAKFKQASEKIVSLSVENSGFPIEYADVLNAKVYSTKI